MVLRHHNLGLTLVEVLATTVLLGLIATVLLHSWSAPTEKSAFRALVAELRNLDARARAAAKTGSPVALSFDSERRRVVAHGRFGGQVVSEVGLPQGAEFVLLRDGVVRTNAVRFDPSGTSCDYAMDFGDGDQRARIEVAGLTGWTSMTTSGSASEKTP